MAAASQARRGQVLLAVILGSAIVFLDGTIVNVALETIGTDLPASLVGFFHDSGHTCLFPTSLTDRRSPTDRQSA
jgi:hypothetical protein